MDESGGADVVGNENYENLEPYVLRKELSVEEMKSLIDTYPNPSFPINTEHIIKICPFVQMKETE